MHGEPLHDVALGQNTAAWIYGWLRSSEYDGWLLRTSRRVTDIVEAWKWGNPETVVERLQEIEIRRRQRKASMEKRVCKDRYYTAAKRLRLKRLLMGSVAIEIKDVKDRLNRWQSWFHSGRYPGPAHVQASYGPLIWNRFIGSGGAYGNEREKVAFSEAEAKETDAVVRMLEEKLFLAVCEQWLRGGTSEQKAHACGCEPKTFYNRLNEAYEQLSYLLENAAIKVR